MEKACDSESQVKPSQHVFVMYRNLSEALQGL